jgi:hypothetical protein
MRNLSMATLVASSALIGGALLGLSPEALADETEAETCLKTKVWEGYNEGWHVRTTTNATFSEGEHRVFLVTLYAKNEYKLMVCGDGQASDIDLVLHDSEGKELARDQSDDREPMLTFKPDRTDTYYVAVYGAKMAAKGAKAGVSFAVTYK